MGAGSSSSDEEMASKIGAFQDWLSGIPGIDEATALASAITHIESGKYDMIVFDTAPTGHTLKLLQLPDILEAGIEKLESWQTKIWGYWDAISLAVKGKADSQESKNEMRKKISGKLKHYKESIVKVGKMLQDQQRTRFVVVCIAEFLSVSESQRLLQELTKCHVLCSHIIVNQLVQDYLTTEDMHELEALQEVFRGRDITT